MTASSTALTRVENVPSTGPIATLLRQVLAWLDSRNTVTITLPAPEPVSVASPDKDEDHPDDDGILKPEEIASRTAELLWAHRGSIEVSLDYDEEQPGMERHSQHEPTASIRLPGGIVVMIRNSGYGCTTISAPDGQTEILEPGHDGSLRRVWTEIRAQAVIDTLGLEDLLPQDLEDDGTRPTTTLGLRLSQALGRHVERRAPVRCTETWTYRNHDKEGRAHDHQHASVWTALGEDVLLRMDSRSGGYDGRSQARPDIQIAILSHPVMGTLTIPGEAVAKGLLRRKSSSLAEALGMALELPAHLPMPRGNAQAARVLRLCREAVAAEPELADSAGTPIRPLVDQHLPELMKRHAAAAAIAPADQLAAIDAELAEGIERVRLAVEDALSCSAVARRQALKAQLGFLALRHPDPVPLLECLPERQAA